MRGVFGLETLCPVQRNGHSRRQPELDGLLHLIDVLHRSAIHDARAETHEAVIGREQDFAVLGLSDQCHETQQQQCSFPVGGRVELQDFVGQKKAEQLSTGILIVTGVSLDS